MIRHFNFIRHGKLITVHEETFESAEKIADEIAEELEILRKMSEEA